MRLFCKMYNIPLSPSAWSLSLSAQGSPPNSLPAMRFMRVIEADHPDLLFKVTDRLFRQVFAEGDSSILAAKPDALAKVLSGTGLDKETIAKLVEKANGPEYKNKPKDEAKETVQKYNAYGVPHMRFEKEGGATQDFMGSDRFELIAHW